MTLPRIIIASLVMALAIAVLAYAALLPLWL